MTDFNPKIHRRGSGRSQVASFDFHKYSSPLSRDLKDVGAIRDLFVKWPLVPYAADQEYTVHGLLHFLNNLKFMSPTTGACFNAIKTFAFGSKIKVDYIEDIEFDLGEEVPVDMETAASFIEFLKEVDVEKGSYKALAFDLYDDYKSNGNYYLEVALADTGGEKTASITSHNSEEICYLATKKNQEKVFVISPIWTEQYLRDNPPRTVAAYPNFSEADGTLRTIIHIKNGNYGWYGRPQNAAAWTSAYREFQDIDYLAKVADRQFTGQVLMEFEDDDIENADDLADADEAIEAGFSGIADRIEQNFSVRGEDPQTIFVMSRSYGAKPAFIHEFKVNTNESFYRFSSEKSRKHILENDQWSERLLGDSVPQGFSLSAFIDELKLKDVSVLEYYRERITYGINLAINIVVEHFGREDYNKLGIAFHSALSLIKKEDASAEDIKNLLEAYGNGVRAGVVTANQDDEFYFRELLAFPEMNSEVLKSWKEDGGIRRPITLKGADDSKTEKTRNNEPKKKGDE